MVEDDVLVAEVVRSGLVESRHRGSVVVLSADGSVAAEAGRTQQPMYPRSANKPAQAAAMLRLGITLDGELLALAAASHSGEAFHVAGVRRILETVGLPESALRNTPDWPLDTESRDALIRHGGKPAAITANCSGKHAAMLATCVVNGWPVDGYLHQTHPVQEAIRAAVGDLAGEPVAHGGVDGCGAPLFALTLTGLARMFRAMALAGAGTAERRTVEAIQSHPEYTSGTTRDEARLIRAVPGLFGKGGAEAVYAVAFDDGRSVALKIDDGGSRARPVVMAAVLRELGVDGPALDELISAPVLGAGRPVGEIRPAATLVDQVRAGVSAAHA
ncbi:asparaginase [Phytoactinopolyspora alkaliphila]|uniref:Asparaginase n=1 Tax=Phytoactinopolyspora alkaliphila TaxID=1783498 RepID=A0A6N9YJ65_9ACTN|nr:asparaginase [Phytoactinopolyspora alkaliphila]NED94975.1 asparaginase [Phytoactinopolyspora alkaliphila]